jgi:hypothetical protein
MIKQANGTRTRNRNDGSTGWDYLFIYSVFSLFFVINDNTWCYVITNRTSAPPDGVVSVDRRTLAGVPRGVVFSPVFGHVVNWKTQFTNEHY